jgi:predicted CoA-binding protein
MLNKKQLRSILKNITSIAIIGASPKPERDSYKVMKFLNDYGFKVFPVNPNYLDHKILGEKCFSNLKEIDQKIDMVDIFRSQEFVYEITEDAIKAGVKVIWTQEGIIDKKSAFIAKNKGIKFVMDECPMKVLMN